ncbi:MAG: PIN domain nuclease [Defluviitaleaceae bacterium]|nr:PIN domain nuclease [Defluviitaleaceae bacterium]
MGGKQNKYDVFTGFVALEEIRQCREPKKSLLENHLADIEYKLIRTTEEIELLADKIIEQGILTKKSYDDCLHIAAAVVAGCDVIVSWNFKHMVNIRTINGVRIVNILNGYRPIDIYAPFIFLERRDVDE